jgi:cobyrinic acid a,c-diamide synthase
VQTASGESSAVSTSVLGPRLVVAGTHSGVGKTTVATGLMAAWRRHGLDVAAAKVGPDFIDPGYHAVATGRPGRNLDVFCCGADAVPGLAARAAAGAGLLVVEGVMGLFDGVGAGAESSTAHVAQLLQAPVVLVVDAASMSGSVAALVYGYDDTLARSPGRHGQGVAGVILNRVGSDTHEALLRQALATPVHGRRPPPPVVGVLRRDAALTWRDRHLGLVPVVERPAAVGASIERLGHVVAGSLDLQALEGIARGAPPQRAALPRRAARVTQAQAAVPVAVASGPAFSFAYPENLERLEEAGAELCFFDPLESPTLPPGARALYAGGGFPEVFARRLSQNTPLLQAVHRAVTAGLPTWAECGGMLWLSRSLDGTPLCDVVPADALMGPKVTVGYRRAEVRRTNPVAPAGAQLRGHEHHCSAVEPAGDALVLSGTSGTRAEGWATDTMLATYLHLHMGADATPAERFVRSAAEAGTVANGER